MSYVTVYGMLHLYAYCYVGKKSTDFFLAFADCLYESNWMALPLELRRSFPLMISHAHRPLHYHGFHVAILNLELFSKVRCFFYYWQQMRIFLVSNVFIPSAANVQDSRRFLNYYWHCISQAGESDEEQKNTRKNIKIREWRNWLLGHCLTFHAIQSD